MTHKPMMLVNGVYQNLKTFSLIPTTSDCPFLEMIYAPDTNVMHIVSKTTREVFMLVEKLDAVGDVMKKKVREGGKTFEAPIKERRTVNEHYHYTIYTQEEMESIIQLYANNADTFDYKKFFSQVDSVAA